MYNVLCDYKLETSGRFEHVFASLRHICTHKEGVFAWYDNLETIVRFNQPDWLQCQNQNKSGCCL